MTIHELVNAKRLPRAVGPDQDVDAFSDGELKISIHRKSGRFVAENGVLSISAPDCIEIPREYLVALVGKQS